MSKQAIEKAGAIISSRTVKNGKYNNETCVLTLIDENGYPYSSVITAGKSDGIKALWFGTSDESNKLKYIAKNNKASVCFPSDTYNISLTGEIEVIEATDENKKNIMWYDGLNETNATKILAFKTLKYSIFLIEGESVDFASGDL